jgi:flagellar motility protein MotE (MotC chaperone)
MMLPPAASSVDSLDVKKAMAILMAMDPNKAADILTGVLCGPRCALIEGG